MFLHMDILKPCSRRKNSVILIISISQSPESCFIKTIVSRNGGVPL